MADKECCADAVWHRLHPGMARSAAPLRRRLRRADADEDSVCSPLCLPQSALNRPPAARQFESSCRRPLSALPASLPHASASIRKAQSARLLSLKAPAFSLHFSVTICRGSGSRKGASCKFNGRHCPATISWFVRSFGECGRKQVTGPAVREIPHSAHNVLI